MPFPQELAARMHGASNTLPPRSELQELKDALKGVMQQNRALMEALVQQGEERQAELESSQDRESRAFYETLIQQQRERDERLMKGQREMHEDMRSFGEACIKGIMFLANTGACNNNALLGNSDNGPAPPPSQPTELKLMVSIERWEASGDDEDTTFRLCLEVEDGPQVSCVVAHLNKETFDNPYMDMNWDSDDGDWWLDWTGWSHFPLTISFCVAGDRRCVAFDMTDEDHHSHYILRV